MQVSFLLSDLDPSSVITIIFGSLTILGAAGGSYLATRIAIAQLSAEVISLKEWVKKVDSGDTKALGKIETRLDTVEEEVGDIKSTLRHCEGCQRAARERDGK